MEFERINDFNQRAKVFGGWIVLTSEEVYHTEGVCNQAGSGWDWRISTCFVPDVNHEWKL